MPFAKQVGFHPFLTLFQRLPCRSQFPNDLETQQGDEAGKIDRFWLSTVTLPDWIKVDLATGIVCYVLIKVVIL